MADDADLRDAAVARRVQDFTDAWLDGQRPQIESYLASASEPLREGLFSALLRTEFELRAQVGERLDLKDYARRFPDYIDAESVAISGDETGSGNVDAHTLDRRTFAASPTASTLDESMPAQLGRYEIRGVLGRGGFGTVYLGYDGQLEREVAIKTSRERGNSDEADPAVTESWSQLVSNERFLREARRVARLRHAGIASVHDVGVDVGHRFIVTDRIDGKTLRESHDDNPLSWRESARIVRAVADALAYAHAHHIVHRDVKPENIMLTRAGDPVLVDFGLAIDMVSDDFSQAEVIGSLPYMSPEQLSGKTGDLDGRTDIYSLGVVLYELLSGLYPYTRVKNIESTWKVLDEPPRPLTDYAPDVPSELHALCMRALSVAPADRFRTADELILALDPVLGQTQRGVQPGPIYIASDEPWIGPERRQVSLVFCRWPVAARMDHGSQARSGHPTASALKTLARRFDGVLTEASSETAVFQFSKEDAASQAVAAALALSVLGDTTAVNDDTVADTPAGSPYVAVVTGMAEVRDGGTSAARGLRVQAATLAGHAASGRVVASHDTYKLVRTEFDCTRIELSGRAATPAQPCWRVDAEQGSQSGQPLAPVETAALVGRAVELELLARALHRAEAGDGQVMLVSADAGLGKSRLLGEFHANIATSALRWTTCRCLPQHANSALYPFVDWLRRAVLDEDGADKALALERLEDLVVAAELPLEEVVPVLAPLIPLDVGTAYQGLYLRPERRKQVTLEAFVMLILSAAEQTPGVLVVEDLHWLDPTSGECLGMLIDEAANSRLLLVMTYRPSFEPPWPARAFMSLMALTPLGDTEATALATQAAGSTHLSAATLEQLIARTDGVPLYIEELTRAYVESVDAIDVAGAQLPATLQASLQARLDRLGSVRELAQCAAVIGKAFTLPQLLAVSGLGQRQAAADVDQLVRAGLLQRRGRGRRLKMTFRHSLMQDAAYAGLPDEKRRLLHLRVAEQLGDERAAGVIVEPEVLAHHFTQAEAFEQALDFWREAGEKAVGASANVEAAAHFREALALVPATRHQRTAYELELLLALAGALAVTRGYAAPELEAVYARAYALGQRTGAHQDLFLALRGLWQFHSGEGRVDEARRIGAQLVELADRSDDEVLRIETSRMLGNNALWTGEFGTARTHLQRAVALYDPGVHHSLRERFGQDPDVANRGMLALAMTFLGDVPTALRELDGVVEYARQLAHPFSRVFAYGSAMWVHKMLLQPDEARAWAIRCAEVAEAHSFAYLDTAAKVVNLWALACAQPHHPDIDEMDAIISAWRGTGATNGVATFLMLRAETLLAAGAPEAAAERLRHDIVSERSASERWIEADLLRLRGQIIEALGSDTYGALASYRDSLAVARAQASPLLELRAWMAMGPLEARLGHPDKLDELVRVTARFASHAGECGVVTAARAIIAKAGG